MIRDISYYRKIQGHYDFETRKEAEISLIKAELERDFANTLDCETVTVNGTSAELLITKTDDSTIKKVVSRPSGAVYLGDIVYWLNSYWIVDNIDADNRISYRGKMRKCNAQLKWMNQNKAVVTRYCFCEDASRGSDGITGGSQIQTGAFQIRIKLRKDSESIKIKRDDRFLIDASSYVSQLHSSDSHVTAFVVTKRNVITGDNNGVGYIEITLIEDAYSDKTDNPYLMIADYYDKTDTHIVSISNTTSPLSLIKGADYQLAATVTKNGDSDQSVIWFYSSDESIATVTQTGKIHAVANGTCTIYTQVADSKQEIEVRVAAVQSGAVIKTYLPMGDSVIYGQTLRVEFDAYENGTKTSTTFSCSIGGTLLPLATVESTGSNYAIIRAANNNDYIGEEFTLDVSSSALSVSASIPLKVRGWM